MRRKEEGRIDEEGKKRKKREKRRERKAVTDESRGEGKGKIVMKK